MNPQRDKYLEALGIPDFLYASVSPEGSAQEKFKLLVVELDSHCLLYTSPSPRDATLSRMPSSA